jgi:hypothetical protein
MTLPSIEQAGRTGWRYDCEEITRMGKLYDEIDERIARWVGKQRMYFVSTAPDAADGHINCSPKGLDSLRITGPRELALLDIGGSGIETVAHLKQNRRIVVMLCAFDGPPRIFRFHGKGEVIEPAHAEFAGLLKLFPGFESARSIVRVALTRISDSCGFGVPRYEFVEDRSAMMKWVAGKSPAEMLQYRADNNKISIDGLPGLDI